MKHLIFKITFIATVLAVVFSVPSACQPNVLFISVDDLNDFPAIMQCYEGAKTPNIDRLAQCGMVFTNAHSQFPLCGPSRASVMSGLYPSTLNCISNIRDNDVKERTEKVGSRVLHEYFSDHGYKTLAKGKIFHNYVPKGSVDVSGGREPGFSQGTGKLCRNWCHKATGTDWAIAPEKDSELADYRTTQWAVKQLNENHDRPFMMMVGFIRPHAPWYVPKKWYDLYDREKITLPPYKSDDLEDLPEISKTTNILPYRPQMQWAQENDQWRSIVHAYLACISFADHQVGEVLNALDNSPYKDNTIIVLWSDHGYHMGEKGIFQKQTLWQRSSHVPLTIAGPNVEAGQRCNRIVSLIDIYPTLIDMCGLPANSKNEGHSLTKLLKKPSKKWNYPAITAWEGNNFAVQTERYRYIIYEDGSEELYDHQEDPYEWHNVASNPELATIKKKLHSQLPKTRFKNVDSFKYIRIQHQREGAH